MRLSENIAKHPRAWYYVLLTCAVTAAFLGANVYLLLQGQELVWTQDALPLYSNFLVWGCDTLRQAVGAVASGAGFELPQYTYTLGYGVDVAATMGSYLQDPINLIAFALPDECIGLSYALMILVRMVLSAFAFSWYCFARGQGRRATGVAALVYATCGFIVFLGVLRHPKFMDWAILLPLVLQGADRLFQKRGPWLFAGALFMQFIVSIYFSYMTCLVVLAYCLIKYFVAPRDRSVRDFCMLVLSFAASGVLAFLVSGPFSLPQIFALLSQERATSGGTTVPLLFSLKYYAKVAAHFIGGAGTTEGLIGGAVGTVGLLAFCLCGRRFDANERRPWLVGFLLCFAGVLVPFFGHVMNGMGYSADRWMLVLAFVGAYILCLTLPRMRAFDRDDWRRASVGAGVVAALSAAYSCAQVFMSDGVAGMVWPACMTVFFVCVFIGMRMCSQRQTSMRLYLFAGVAAVLAVTLSGAFYCSPLGQNWTVNFPKAGSTWKSISKNSPGAAAEHIDDGGFWRYTLPRIYGSMKNSGLVHGEMGVDYYSSYYNQRVDDFRQALGMSDHHMNFSFGGSDSRLAVEDVTGVKYYITQDRDVWRVPYGFTDTGVEFGKFKVFENENPVPLAFALSSIVPEAEYEKLSMVEKQEALLQGAVVDESALDAPVEHIDVKLNSREVDYEVVDTDGMELDAGGAHVCRKGAKATIRFKGLAESETYLVLENLDYAEYAPSVMARISGKEPSLSTTLSDALWTRTTTYPITARSGTRSNRSIPATPEHRRYGGKHDWVFNLAYSEKPLTEMTVEFDEPGDYTFDAMRVVCQPVKPVVEASRALAAAGLDDLKLYTNGMSATCKVAGDDPVIAVFSVAYTPGWSVTVDGGAARALTVDTAFCGVEIAGEGEHVIEWSYETPGVRAGAAMAAVGIVAAFAAVLVRRYLRRRNGKETQR